MSMRIVKVILVQDRDNPDLFYVARFSNSAELSVGDAVSRQTLEDWIDRSKFPRVEFTVAGLTPETEDQAAEETETSASNRADPLEL